MDGSGAEATQTHRAARAAIILLTHLTSTFSSMYPDEKLMTGPRPAPPSLPPAGQLESLKWNHIEWGLAQLCVQEDKPNLRPLFNPVFSQREVQLTTPVRGRNHAGNLSRREWADRERLRTEEDG